MQMHSSTEKIASGYNGKNIEKEVFCAHRDDKNIEKEVFCTHRDDENRKTPETDYCRLVVTAFARLVHLPLCIFVYLNDYFKLERLKAGRQMIANPLEMFLIYWNRLCTL